MSRDSNQAVYFQCQLCGECCSSWNIPVETEKAEALLQKEWVQARLRETRRELTRQSAAIYRIPLTDENVCVFLGADRRCLIEVHEGLALKPHECQRFPFATVRLPDGTAIHDTSAACKSISEKLLLAFEPIRPKPDPKAEQASDFSVVEPSPNLEEVGVFPERVWLSPFRKTDWHDYLAWQTHWKSWFQDDALSASEVLSRVKRSLKARTIDASEAKSNPLLRGILLLGFLRKPYRTLSLFSLLRGKSYHDPRLFGEAINLKAQGQVAWDDRHERHLKAFLYNLLCRKRLLSAGGSAQSLLAMAGIALVLVQWYARALASLQAQSATTEKDVATAIRLVERYYTGHQPRFFDFFLSRWKGWLIFHLLRL